MLGGIVARELTGHQVRILVEFDSRLITTDPTFHDLVSELTQALRRSLSDYFIAGKIEQVRIRVESEDG